MMDFCRTDDAVVLESEPDLIIQQIDILFDTVPGEVLGYPKYGADYEKFLHDTNVGNKYIQEYIYDNITSNVDLMGWKLDVEVNIIMGNYNDIILANIMFSKDHDKYFRTYKIDRDILEQN